MPETLPLSLDLFLPEKLWHISGIQHLLLLFNNQQWCWKSTWCDSDTNDGMRYFIPVMFHWIPSWLKYQNVLNFYSFLKFSRISRNHDTLMRKKEVAHQSSPVLSPSHTFVLFCSIVMCQVCAFALPRTPTLAEKQPVLLNWQPQLCHINNVSSQCLLQTRSHLKIQFNLPHFLVLD